jgi:hypothetical protein
MSALTTPTNAWQSTTVAANEIWQVHSGAILVDDDAIEANRLGVRLNPDDWIEWTSAKTIYYRLAYGTTAIVTRLLR